jgi:hypothetical protein
MSWKLFAVVLLFVILSLVTFFLAVTFLGIGAVGIKKIKEAKEKSKVKKREENKTNKDNNNNGNPNKDNNNNGNGTNNNGQQQVPPTLVPIASKPVVGSPYTVPKITSVYHSTCVLPATVGDSTKGASTKVADVSDMFWATNILTTHQQHGTIDFVFVIADITKCRGVQFRATPPGYAKLEQDLKAAIPKFQDLLQKLTNGHLGMGKTEIVGMELACATDYVPKDWCFAQAGRWIEQVRGALDAKTPTRTMYVIYTPGVGSCWGGMASILCKHKKAPENRCHMYINNLIPMVFVHELCHNLGLEHCMGDNVCVMASTVNNTEYINAYYAYIAGWLDNAELVELDRVCGESSQQQPVVKLNLKPDSKHGIVLYLAVAVFVGDRFGSEHLADKHSDVVPFPFATIAQRTFSNGQTQVLVHAIDPGLALPPTWFGLAAPYVHKLAHLDQVGTKYKLDTSRAQGVPLAFVYSKGWSTWSPVSPSIFSTLGFNAGNRAKLLNLEITLTEKSATGAVVTLSRV